MALPTLAHTRKQWNNLQQAHGVEQVLNSPTCAYQREGLHLLYLTASQALVCELESYVGRPVVGADYKVAGPRLSVFAAFVKRRRFDVDIETRFSCKWYNHMKYGLPREVVGHMLDKLVLLHHQVVIDILQGRQWGINMSLVNSRFQAAMDVMLNQLHFGCEMVSSLFLLVVVWYSIVTIVQHVFILFYLYSSQLPITSQWVPLLTFKRC
jgi:hypothetical protein